MGVTMKFYIFATVALIYTFFGGTSADDFCSNLFRKNGYVPKYAKNIKTTDLKVTYAGKPISCGSTANLLQVAIPPTLYYNAPSCCKNITVLAFAPDVIVLAPYVTWLIQNIPPENLRNGFTTPLLGNTRNNGYLAADYIIPEDPSGGVKTNTIIIFVYCQKHYIQNKKYILPTDKGLFDVQGFAEKNDLRCPMAGFFHRFSATGLDVSNQTKGLIPDSLISN